MHEHPWRLVQSPRRAYRGKLKEAIAERYWQRPSPELLSRTKHKESDFPEPVVEVWNENWDVVSLFITYQSQWRVGMNGAIGLDFNVFHHALDRKGVSTNEYDDFIQKLRVIEAEALKWMHHKS